MTSADEQNVKERLRRIASESETCIHWRPMKIARKWGPGDETCKAGVDYVDAFGKEAGISLRIPCRPAYSEERQQPQMTCPIHALEKKGPERATVEYDERMAEFEGTMERIFKVLPAIDATGTGPRQGELLCPCCKNGTLVYSVASNGHRLAKCSTPDCIAFIE